MTIMEHVNGTRQQGRVVPPLPEHTFKDSGITIKIRKVGPTTQQRLAQQIMKELPEPQPPTVETEIGAESNPADPAYLAALEVWNTATRNELTQRLLLIAALEAEVVIDEQLHVRIGTYKDEHGDGFGGWSVERGMAPKSKGAVWMRLHIAGKQSEYRLAAEVTRAT